MVDPEPTPSELVVEQRIRNRIIEYLELASSFEAQRDYDRNTIAFVPHEVIELWADCNPVDHSRWPGRRAAPYFADEIDAMVAFHEVWEWVIAHTPNPMPNLAEVQQLPAWERLRRAAAQTLEAFERRGRLSEDDEA